MGPKNEMEEDKIKDNKEANKLNEVDKIVTEEGKMEIFGGNAYFNN